MELIINKFGAKIGKRGERIYVFDPATRVTKEYPVRRISKIVIARPAALTSSAVQLAISYDIDIVYLGRFGMPYGRIYSSKPGRLILIKRRQLEKSSGQEATYLAKQFIFGKIKNQINYLYFLKKNIKGFSFPEKGLFDLLRILNLVKGQIEHARDQFFGIEGRAADLYFGALRRVIDFPGRNPDGKDIFNVTLNYGYGILYNEVERNCLEVGLDPFMGFLHTERYGKPSLVLDLVEELRVPLIDSITVPLFIPKQILTSQDVELSGGEALLKPKAKSAVVAMAYSRLYQKVNYRGRQMRMTTAIKNHMRDFAHYLIGRKREYKPFLLYDFRVNIPDNIQNPKR